MSSSCILRRQKNNLRFKKMYFKYTLENIENKTLCYESVPFIQSTIPNFKSLFLFDKYKKK